MTDRKVLDLDQLMGLDRPIIVRLHGAEYELKRPDAFGPLEIQRFQRTERLYNALVMGYQGGGADFEKTHTPEEAERQAADWLGKAGELMGSLIAMLCPELGQLGLGLAQQVKIIEFYHEQVDNAGEKKVEPPPTGGTSTAGSPPPPIT